MRESRPARLLVLRADVIPDIHSNDRTIVIFVDENIETVLERLLCVGDIHPVTLRDFTRSEPFLYRKPQMARRMLLLVAAGQFLGMTLWFSASAAAPAIAAELSITRAEVAWPDM